MLLVYAFPLHIIPILLKTGGIGCRKINNIFMSYLEQTKRHEHIHLPLGRIAKYTGGTNTAGKIMTHAIMAQHICRQLFIPSFSQIRRKIDLILLLPPSSDSLNLL